jgi:hypothetical protein
MAANLLQKTATTSRTTRAMAKRISTSVYGDNPLVSRLRVRTAAEPHPRVATMSGVHGFIRPGRYRSPDIELNGKSPDTDTLGL